MVLDSGKIAVQRVGLTEYQQVASATAGVLSRTEAHFALPAIYGIQDQPGTPGIQARLAGIGDITGGLKYDLIDEGTIIPEIVPELDFTAPTGHSPFHLEPNVELGSGFWSATAGVTVLKAIGPVTMSAEFQFDHSFGQTYFHQFVQPGNGFIYSAAISYPLKDFVITQEVLGELVGDEEVHGHTLTHSSMHPLSTRATLTWLLSSRWELEPTINVGLNRDAPKVVAGIGFTYKF